MTLPQKAISEMSLIACISFWFVDFADEIDRHFNAVLFVKLLLIVVYVGFCVGSPTSTQEYLRLLAYLNDNM